MYQLYNAVSIHAPVWGATVKARRIINGTNVSIHAPVWGATFQAFCVQHYGVVSIHAPVWGATMNALDLEAVFERFNPRTRVGCDS